MLSLMLAKVNEGKLTIKRLVETMSENPAKIWGFYPRKGVIKLGSDADFTIVDMKLEKTIRGDQLHTKNQWTPFEGIRVRGVPIRTIIRGSTVMLNGEVIGNKGHGCFIS